VGIDFQNINGSTIRMTLGCCGCQDSGVIVNQRNGPLGPGVSDDDDYYYYYYLYHLKILEFRPSQSEWFEEAGRTANARKASGSAEGYGAEHEKRTSSASQHHTMSRQKCVALFVGLLFALRVNTPDILTIGLLAPIHAALVKPIPAALASTIILLVLYVSAAISATDHNPR